MLPGMFMCHFTGYFILKMQSLSNQPPKMIPDDSTLLLSTHRPQTPSNFANNTTHDSK